MDTAGVVFVAVGWLAGWWLLLRLRPLDPPLPVDGRALRLAKITQKLTDFGVSQRGLPDRQPLSVVIPARNEAHTLPALLDSLRTQVADIVVVDDSSDDGTAEVAAASGVRVVSAPPPPTGWAGKAWACHLGAGSSGGDRLLFLDADTVLSPDGLDRLLASYDGGLLSVQPWHRCGAAAESLSAVFNLVSMMGVGAFAGLPGTRSPSAAFGPVILCSRADYTSVGGHAAVRGSVVEDVALARRFRAAGLPVRCRTGRGAIEFRMYPLGLRQLVEGWTKNIAEGARSATRPWALALTVWWVAALVTVGMDTALRPGPMILLGYGAVAGQMAWLLRRIGHFAWWAWLGWPVPLAVFVLVFIRSLVLRLFRRPASWKGRSIPAR